MPGFKVGGLTSLRAVSHGAVAVRGWTRRSCLKIAGTGLLAPGVLRAAQAATANEGQEKEAGMNQEAVWTDAADTMPVEILRQTFQVRTAEGTGTAFTVEVDGRQYIVTAQHVIGSMASGSLDMQTSSAGWGQVPVMAVGMAGLPVDVAVMATDSVLGSRSSVPVGVSTVSYGQAVRFLGYPFGLDFTPIQGVRTAPLPFIKGGILSALRPVPNEDGLLELFVDAAGNPGFSGGPLILPRHSTGNGNSVAWHIAGVVTSGVTHRVALKDVSGAVAGLVHVDAGILRATSIDAVTRMIRANPIGHQLSQ